MPSSRPTRSPGRFTPRIRLLIPLLLILAATVALWGPKLGWFPEPRIDFAGLGTAAPRDDAGQQLATDTPAEPATDADAPAGSAPARPAEAVPVTIDYVHDGDTLFVFPHEATAVLGSTEKTKVRLLGIDTPEVGDNAECYGGEATEALRALLPEGSTAWALTDVNPTDKYDRSLLLMWTEDGRFVNNELLAGGAATVLQIDPNRAHTELFRASEDHASSSGAGLWGAC